MARANGVEVVFVLHDDGPGTGFSVGDVDYEIYVPEYSNSTSDNEYMDKETCYNYHNKFL